jgi:hypothetical protein
MGEHSPMYKVVLPYSFNYKSSLFETNEPALRNLALKPPLSPVNAGIWKKGIVAE